MTRKEILEKTIDFDDAINRIVRLEEENTELKEKYAKNITDCDICDTYCNSQLTKAKEIIREVMNWYWETDIYSDTMPQELRQKAEQFISEVEK